MREKVSRPATSVLSIRCTRDHNILLRRVAATLKRNDAFEVALTELLDVPQSPDPELSDRVAALERAFIKFSVALPAPGASDPPSGRSPSNPRDKVEVDFASRVKTARETKGWSVIRLSSSTGVPAAEIELIESGDLNGQPTYLRKLAKSLGIAPPDESL